MKDLPSVESSLDDWQYQILNPSLRMTISPEGMPRSDIHALAKEIYRLDSLLLELAEDAHLDGPLTTKQTDLHLQIRKRVEITKCRVSTLIATALETPNNTKEI